LAGERRCLGCWNRRVRRIQFARKRIDHWNGKIRRSVGERRNAVEVENLRQLAKSFVIAEEEEPVLDDRPADCGAKLIPLQQRFLEGRRTLPEDVADRVQIGVAKKLVSSAMKLVRTGPGGGVD